MRRNSTVMLLFRRRIPGPDRQRREESAGGPTAAPATGPRAFGLRAALTLLVLIAIAPVFLVVVQGSLAEQRGRLARAQADLRSIADLVAAHQEGLVEGARQFLIAMAHSPPVYGDDLRACMGYMKTLQGQYPNDYGTFGLLDEGGRLVCRATAPTTAVNSSDRLFFRTTMQSGRFSIGEYTVSRASGRPVLTFGFPVHRDNGTLRGVAYLALDLERAHRHLQTVVLPPGTSLTVADASGVVLAGAGPRSLEVGTVLPDGALRRAMTPAAPRSVSGLADGTEPLFAVQAIGRPGEGALYVAAISSTADVIATTEQRLYLQLGALVLITLLGAGAAWLFGERVLARPIARMLDRIDALQREELKLDAPPAQTGLRELRELDRRVHEMARSLAERAILRDGAMAEMAGQKHLLESILESMAEGVLVIDRRGRLILTNAAAARVMPGAAELVKETDVGVAIAQDWGLFHLDGETPLNPAERPALRALAGENVDNFRFLIRGRLSGGPEKVILSHSRALLSAEGDRYGAVLVFSDVTAAYRAEEALRDSEHRYRTLFESNPHPMWVYDLQTLRFLTVNDAAVAHYGYTRSEFLAMTIADIRPEGDARLLLEAVDQAQGLRPQIPWRHRRKDGRLIDVEISSHVLDYGGRPGRVVLAHDITERRTAQRELEYLNETLERRVADRTRELALSNRELESFSYSVSHDLRAPLQAIDGFSRALVSHHAAQLDGQARHYMERITENTRRMGQLIDDLLSLASVTRTEIRMQPLNLADEAERIVERLRQGQPGRHVDVEIDPYISCRGDPGLLAVVLENLLQNAWKFTARTPDARIRVGHKTSAQGEKVVFVADNGAGFDMAYSAKLFTAFQRLHPASEFEGTGIGLATVHRIITRHGGRVWAESSPGRGASFQFTLE